MAISDRNKQTPHATSSIDDNRWGDGGASYAGTPISQMSAEQLDSLPAWQTISPNMNHSWVKTMMNEVAARRAQLQWEDYQGAMSEAMLSMAKKMSVVEDAKEPLKDAAENYDAAADDVAKRQNLRNGLLALFTRYNTSAFSSASGNGLATKLGG